MTRYIDFEYVQKLRNKQSYGNIDNIWETMDILNWQSAVYGERKMADIMDAYNDSKLQYVM